MTVVSCEAESETFILGIEALDEVTSPSTSYETECEDGDGNIHSGTIPTGSVTEAGLTDDVYYT